ncbi:MAG: RseA family anti-sigma factor, partial [bacterium]
MKDVSALMDGELERKRVRSTITRLEDQDELRDAWATFH